MRLGILSGTHEELERTRRAVASGCPGLTNVVLHEINTEPPECLAVALSLAHVR
jgi:hypothetical protein